MTKLNKNTIVPLFVLCSVLCLNTDLSAQPISWSNTAVTGTGDVSNNGGAITTGNTGGGGVFNVNNVNFIPGGNPLGNGFTGANPGNVIGDAQFDGLINTASFGDGSLNVGGLTSGRDYEVQLFMADNRGCCSGRTVTVNDGVGNMLTTPGIGTPQSVVGTFTATAGSKSINILNPGADPGYLNAYQVRDVTPGTVGTVVTLSTSTLTGVGDISGKGVLVEAFNTGGGGAINVGGIDFLAGGNPLGSGFDDANPNNLIGDVNFDALLDSSSFGTTPLTLSGLTIGTEYELQMFLTDNRGCCSGRTVDIAALEGNFLTTPGIGTPQNVIASFVAGSSDVTLFFNGSADLGYLNGYQLREIPIPEPSALLLAATGLLGLGFLGRRRRKR